MRIFALLLGIACTVGPAEAGVPLPFVLTCEMMVVGPAKTDRTPLRIEWDGTVLTTTSVDWQEKPTRFSETVIQSQLIPPPKPGVFHVSFLTGIHQVRNYRYHLALVFAPSGGRASLTQMFATLDQDGFLINSSSLEYESCQMRAA